jgi:hypothetical protein
MRDTGVAAAAVREDRVSSASATIEGASMRKSFFALLMTAVSAFCLTSADVSGTRAEERETDVPDARWKKQFVGAVKWSSLGVVDDSGATDNTAALNALPVNRPIIGDCPHGGVVQFNGTWVWRSGLTVWQQTNCHLKSTITTLNDYPITIPGGNTAPSPIANVEYYGMNFGFMTPTNQVRVMLVWINHFKFKHFIIDGSGGLAYIRGSDQEIAYGLLKNTLAAVGNPGIRHFGNVPLVPTSPGMRANVWIHHNNFETGDGTFQACQPGTNPRTWTYSTSTDGLLYEDNVGSSASSALIMVNEPLAPSAATNYRCRNVTFRNVSGSGLWYALISSGNDNSVTENIVIEGGAYDGAQSENHLASIGVGNVTYGGATSTSLNTTNVILRDLKMTNVHNQAVRAMGAVRGFVLENSRIEAPRSSALPLVELQGMTGSAILNNSLITLGNDALAVGTTAGPSNVSERLRIIDNIIGGVRDGRAGIRLKNVNAAVVHRNVIAPAASTTKAVGISLAVNPNGTTNSTVTNNNVTAMTNNPPIICAVGQGNVVSRNAGASDCGR